MGKTLEKTVGHSGTIQELVEAQPNFLERAFDGAFRPSRLLRDFGYFVALDSQLDHDALRFGQLAQRILDAEVEDRRGADVLGGRQEAGVGGFRRQTDVAFARSVERFFGTNLVQGDHQEQAPQQFSRRHVIVALEHTPEEPAKD